MTKKKKSPAAQFPAPLVMEIKYSDGSKEEWRSMGAYRGKAGQRARLLSAAPDLLAALKAVLNVPCMNLDEMEPSEITARRNGWAAIRKAEGGSK